MRVFKFFLCLAITAGLVYVLDRPWTIKNAPVPPVGRFLDPFQGFWANLEDSGPQIPDAMPIPGLRDKVNVLFDSLAMPHIFAQNEEDLYFAQGYITAHDRLWQMEFQTHAAAGRLTEIIGRGPGDAVLNYDRGQRRLGLAFGAEQALKSLESDPVTRKIVEKYTEGVNAYIQTLDYKTLPFEYKLLHYKPEPWTPLKCALLLKSMAQTLNMRDKDMEMTNALSMFGFDVLQTLYPDREPVSDPIVDKPNGWKFKPVTLDTVPLALPDELIQLKKLPAEPIKVKKLPVSDPTTGSNNWAVSGSKTATGSPLLCSDPHLGLNLPSLWYALQLHAPGVNTMGASLPGAPGVIIGCTDSIAWGVTNAQRDLVDWFQISFQDNKHDKYLLDGQWVDTKRTIEKFVVKDGPAYYDTVLYTHWGPVTYDDTFGERGNPKYYAFRWISHDPSNEFLAFYKLNRAKNHKDYMDALDLYESPAQNFVFASVAGDIAMRIQGKFPVRRQQEGKFLLDGSKSSNGWMAFIPNDQNIMDKNPARGFVSSANQYPADGTYPYYITASSFEAYRNRRINQTLAGLDHIRPEDMMKLQTDNFNLKAEESLPYFLKALDSASLTPTEQKARQILASWNRYNDKASEGASYYEAWWNSLMPLIWDEMAGHTLEDPTTFNTIYLLKEKPTFSFFDILNTPEKETATEVIRKAFSQSVASMEKWKKDHAQTTAAWGDYKDGYVGHLTRLEPLRVYIKAGGNRDIVNAHSRTHGPSWRMIVSLEKSGVKMWAVYPGGQSGNLGSAHYVDMLQPWVDGQYFPIPFLRDPRDAKIKYSTQLHP
jgi:penicillin amidase